MRLSRKQKPTGEIDLAAFSDLAFLLIVFFVLTTTFIRPKGASVAIPSQTHDPERKPAQEPPTINLSVNSIAFNGELTTVEELRAELFDMELAKQKDDDRIVVLESTPDVSYDRYYRVVTAIAAAGGVMAIAEDVEDEGGGEGPAEASGAPRI